MIFVLNDHKTGFILTRKIFNIIKKKYKLKLSYRTFYLFWNIHTTNHKYIIITRHPKEIIISGYLYHKKCSELWCVNKNGFYYNYWIDNHFLNEEIIKNTTYINRIKNVSNNSSYQNKLNTITQNQGIILEMKTIAYNTIMGMYNYNYYDKSNVLTIKFEDLIFNFEETIHKIFIFLDISITKDILNKLLKHNIINLKNNNILLQHTTNINFIKNRYKLYWNQELEKEFLTLYPKDILSKFEYS